MAALKSGEFQSAFESYFEYKLPLRKTGTRIYNQLLYSLFNSTDRDGFLVGRSNYIYERAYPDAYLTEVPASAVDALKKDIEQLARLNQLVKEHGSTMLVRISPTKAQHYPEYMPAAYKRFVDMKARGEYGPNWYEVFRNEIRKTEVPVYDRYDYIEQMKRDGHIVFTKGGTHWSQYPLVEYINGLNEELERLLAKKLGRMTVVSAVDKYGQMGIYDDRDIWDICWNAVRAEPEYLSPNITFESTPGEFAPTVFTIGQSFSNILLSTIFHNTKNPVWGETDFSWYNSYVLRFPNPAGLPWGGRVADKTTEFESYLAKDVIMVEFLETSTYPNAVQFEFVKNMVDYLENQRIR